jgi:hypothetical protein
MLKAPASVSDRLEELEKRLDSIEKRAVPSAKATVTRFFVACMHRDEGAATPCRRSLPPIRALVPGALPLG